MPYPVLNNQEQHRESDSGLLESMDNERILIVHNDDHNTFDWVIDSLVKICGHHPEQAEQCSYIIHFNGKCQVCHGPEKLMMKKYMALTQRGLTVTIE